VIVLVFALAGCQPAATPEPTTEKPAPTEAVEEPAPTEAVEEPEPPTEEPMEEVTLTVWFLSGSPEEVNLMQEMANQFAEANPGVTVDFSNMGFDDMNTSLRLALDGGTGPDVAYASPGAQHGTQYAAAGHLLDLTQIAEERGWTEKYSESVIAHYNIDKLFQMPFDLVTVGSYYNEEIFTELGLTPPETFEEMDAALAAIKEAGITPIAVGALDNWPLAHVWSQIVHTTVPIETLGKLESGDPNESYMDPAFVKATTKFKEWADAGYFQDDVLATAYMDGNNLFINTDAAMNIGGTWNNGTFSVQPEFQVRFFPTPQLDPSIPWHMGGFTPNNAWMVPVYGEHQDVAVDFVDYMLGEEVASAKWAAGDIVAYKFDEVPPSASPLQADVYDAMQKTGTGYYLGNYNGEVQAMIWQSLQELVAGALTVEEALGQIQSTYESVLGE